MKRKKVTLSILLFLLITSLLFLHFIAYRNCQTFKIFKATLDFGTEHVQRCFSKHAIQKNVKHYVIKFPLLYKIAVKYKRNFIRKDYEFDNKIFENFGGLSFSDSENLNFPIANKNYKETLKVPFIKGLINSEFKPLETNITRNTDYEYNNWFRSHGGYWNTKYDAGNSINKKNIKKLKLAWKYSSIKKNDLKKKWKQNIELNPVFINNKIILITADLKVIALKSDDGTLLWELQSLFQQQQ